MGFSKSKWVVNFHKVLLRMIIGAMKFLEFLRGIFAGMVKVNEEMGIAHNDHAPMR